MRQNRSRKSLPMAASRVRVMLIAVLSYTCIAERCAWAVDLPSLDANDASTYVPLGSWIYSAFDRLTSQGLVRSTFFDMRPCTRLACAHLVKEAESLAPSKGINPQIGVDLNALHREFVRDDRWS